MTKRQANINETSGQNINSYVQLYDTHRNAHFEVGDEVVLADTSQVPIVGKVLGHVAEDRLIVQWPYAVGQEDVDDLVKKEDFAYNFSGKRKTATKKHITAFWGQPSYEKQRDQRNQAWFQQFKDRFHQNPRLYNALMQPEVKNILKKVGMHASDIDSLGKLYGSMLLKRAQSNPSTDPEFGAASRYKINPRVTNPKRPGVPQSRVPQSRVPQWGYPMPVHASRLAAIQRLRDLGKKVSILGYTQGSQNVLAAAEFAASLDSLYASRKTREASRGPMAAEAIHNVIRMVLATAEGFRESSDVRLHRIADAYEADFLSGISYAASDKAEDLDESSEKEAKFEIGNCRKADSFSEYQKEMRQMVHDIPETRYQVKEQDFHEIRDKLSDLIEDPAESDTFYVG